jgi:hypothetical protein
MMARLKNLSISLCPWILFTLGSLFQCLFMVFDQTALASEKTRKIIDQKSCEQIVSKKLPEYTKLYQYISSRKSNSRRHPITALLDMQKKDCKTIENRKSLQLAFGSHSKKIGILLPSNHSFHTPIISRSMDYAVKAYFEKNSLDLKKHVVIKRHSRGLNSLKRKLAELVFRSGASIIIGGLQRLMRLTSLKCW